MSDSVMEELLAENAQLRAKLEADEIGNCFQVLSTKPMKITGVLLAEGVWKGIKYSYDKVIKPALEKFKNLPGMVMHGKTEEFKDRIIGKITKVQANDLLKAITFEAEVTDPEAIKKIEDGTFDAVSVKGKFEDIDMTKTPPEGLNYTPIEWSLTGTPACKNCLIFTKELSMDIEKLFKNENVEGDKVIAMSEEFEVKEGEVLVLPDNWDDLEEFSEVELQIVPFQELAKAKKKAKVVKVPPGKYPKVAKTVVKYYGYPYPYYYYPYYYYYGYPYYGYPYYEEKSLDEILDILPLADDYKSFMKTCMREKKDIKDVTERMKACAAEWKKKSEQSENKEEIKETETEMAAIKCPACGQEFKSKKALVRHWNKEHKEEYGEYGTIAKVLQDRGLVEKLRKTFALEDKPEEEEKKEEAKVENKQVENKPEEKPKTEEQKPVEEKKEVTTEQPKQEVKEEPKTVSLKEIYEKLEKTPHTAADLLIATLKKKYEEEF